MYLWIKAFHIVFIASWFAGLFYLPRIFVNLAQETNPAVLERLLGMGRRLYRFTSMLMIPAGIKGGWLHAKLALVILVIGYHHACGSLLKKFERGANTRSHKWFRVFNEVPVLLLIGIVILVVVKPF
jgi:putative membrane protein